MSALQRIKSTLARGGPHLGDLVWWTLTDARIDRSTLEKIWSNAGLDLAQLPEAPSAEKALKSAVRLAALGQVERLVRPALENESEIIFAIVREQRHGDGTLSYTQQARVALDRKTETVTTDAPSHDIASAILSRYAELKDTHPSDDVRRAMMNVLGACAAITLRDHGGVYWIPNTHAAMLRRLQAAIEQIGSSRVYLLPVHDSADANKTLGEAAVATLTTELETLKAEVENFLKEPPARASTLVHRLDAFEELRRRAEVYKQVLSVTVTDLDRTLTELTGSIEQLLNQKAAA